MMVVTAFVVRSILRMSPLFVSPIKRLVPAASRPRGALKRAAPPMASMVPVLPLPARVVVAPVAIETFRMQLYSLTYDEG